MNIIGGGQTPYYKKVMGFIDGSNLLIELSKELGIEYKADKPPLPTLNDRQSYNHPHEKKSGNQQESPVFSHIL